MHPYLALEHPLRFAHRGSRVLWPENTAVAFQGAVDLGYRYIETDVRITADGVVVVFHDPTLTRTTNGMGRVDAWAWDDLRHLDAAWSFGADRGYPRRGTGVGISRLDDVLAAWPDIHFNIDLKSPRMEWAVAEVIRRTRRQDSVLIAAFSDARIARFRRITRDAVATSAGPRTTARALVASRVGLPAPRGPVAYQVPFDNRALPIGRRFIDAAHAASAQVHMWTVNEENDMRRMLDAGVDGIVTDRPDRLNTVLGFDRG
ncbi:glycerophosphodiester phosphodiesterase [soil metagenome]